MAAALCMYILPSNKRMFVQQANDLKEQGRKEIIEKNVMEKKSGRTIANTTSYPSPCRL